jgi:hypothetical protein
MSKPWFGPKTYGYGLSPISVEGWLVTAAFVAIAIATVPVIRLFGLPDWTAGLAIAVEVAALLSICLAKSDGSPWRWRWGGKK